MRTPGLIICGLLILNMISAYTLCCVSKEELWWR